MATFEERYDRFVAGAKKKTLSAETFDELRKLAPEPEQPADTPVPKQELPLSGKLDEAARRELETFVKNGDLAAIYNFVEHLLKYDRKLTTLLNAAAFEDEVKKVFRRQFRRREGAAARRLSDSHPGVTTPEASTMAPGVETMAGIPSFGRLGFIFIDLDDFKKLNDTKGHLAGDAALQAVAAVLNEGIREHDIKGRFGGEELVVAVEMEHEGDHFVVAEKLRRLIESLPVKYGGEELHVTASIGAAELKVGETYEELVDRANWAMKFAKAKGKNRAVPAEVDEVQAWVASKKGVERRSEPR